MEMVQWGFDFFSPFWFLYMIPFFGPIFEDAFKVDWSRTYAYGALGDIAMATTNMKCAANTYADLSKLFKPDYVFEQDNDFYLQSVGAAQ